MFYNALEKLIIELKDIMKRDLQKKMIQSSAFQSFDAWWDAEDAKHKVRLRKICKLCNIFLLHLSWLQ